MRYVPIVRRLRPVLTQGSAVLEVGANENGFARFSGVSTVVVDRSFAHVQAARATQDVVGVVADACALPFADDACDVCVSVDTLEHIPEPTRPAALRALVQVLKPSGTAVIAFPAGRAAAMAEEEIRQAYRGFTGRPLHWLEEHAEAGLPEPEAVAEVLRAEAAETHTLTLRTNTPVWLWRWMWRVLMCGWPGRGNAVFQALLRLCTPALVQTNWGEAYRTAIWLEPSRRQ